MSTLQLFSSSTLSMDGTSKWALWEGDCSQSRLALSSNSNLTSTLGAQQNSGTCQSSSPVESPSFKQAISDSWLMPLLNAVSSTFIPGAIVVNLSLFDQEDSPNGFVSWTTSRGHTSAFPLACWFRYVVKQKIPSGQANVILADRDICLVHWLSSLQLHRRMVRRLC